MSDAQQKASDFRRYAALCSKFAETMSVRDNRDRMMEMAQRFLELAQKEEANARWRFWRAPNSSFASWGARMSKSGNDLPVDARERLERIVIELVGIAARPEIDHALREELLMRLAAQISSVLEEWPVRRLSAIPLGSKLPHDPRFEGATRTRPARPPIAGSAASSRAARLGPERLALAPPTVPVRRVAALQTVPSGPIRQAPAHAIAA
jgi:hypothetical protein